MKKLASEFARHPTSESSSRIALDRGLPDRQPALPYSRPFGILGKPRQLETARQSVTFVSTYPPTRCGIATFTRALMAAIATERRSSVGLNVVSLVDSRIHRSAPEVTYQHLNGNDASRKLALDAIQTADIVVFQHEFGIYGGADGEEILDMITLLQIPSVVVLHTVPANPTMNQRRILETLAKESSKLIVLSQSALNQLLLRYEVDPAKVTVVSHGAITSAGRRHDASESSQLLTWGLIGPGKGLETAIDAVAQLKDIQPRPRYLIQGGTHPKVRESIGTGYLDGLVERAHGLDLDDVVEFDNRYVALDSLNATIRRSDIVVLPYDSTEQVTSGVLVEALAAGKPVVATEFPHAVEMLSAGAGIVVPSGDSNAMAAALRRMITSPREMETMRRAAERLASKLDWASVASSYEVIFRDLARGQIGAADPHGSSPSAQLQSSLARTS